MLFHELKVVRMTALVTLLFGSYSANAAVDYYVDSVGGDDDRLTSTDSAPWQSLTKISNTNLSPGDRIFLKRGSIWNQQTLNLRHSGTAEEPISVSAYGSGDIPLPVIDGGKAFLNSEWAVHSTPSTPVHASNWDSGTLLDQDGWDSINNVDGVLGISASTDTYDVINGSHSLHVTKSGSATGYLEKTIATTNEIYIRFLYRHAGAQVGAGEFTILELANDNNAVLQVGIVGGGRYPYFDYRFNGWDDVRAYEVHPTSDNRPHLVEVHYKAGAGDGEITIQVDGVTVVRGQVSGLQNAGQDLNRIRLGLMQGATVDISANHDEYWIDQFAYSTTDWLRSPATIYSSSLAAQSGRVWDLVDEVPLRGADAKGSSSPKDFLLPGEYTFSEGLVYIAPRDGLSPMDSRYEAMATQYGVEIIAKHVHLRDLHIRNHWRNGIKLWGASSDIVIEDSLIEKSGRICIRAYSSDNLTVRNNRIRYCGGMWNDEGGGWGVMLGGSNGESQNPANDVPSDNAIIQGNHISDVGEWTNHVDDRVSAGYFIEASNSSANALIADNLCTVDQSSHLWWEVFRHGKIDCIHMEKHNHAGPANIVRNNLSDGLTRAVVVSNFNAPAIIHNNTLKMPDSGSTQTPIGIVVGGTPRGNDFSTTNVQIANNIVDAGGHLLPFTNTSTFTQSAGALVTTADYIPYVTSNYNLVHLDPSAITQFRVDDMDMDWAGWKSFTNWDSFSIGTGQSPLLLPEALARQSEVSPGRDQGNDLGIGIPYSGTAPDIGYAEGVGITILNQNMEDTAILGWQPHDVNQSSSSTTVHQGSAALKVTGNKHNAGNRSYAPAMTVIPGESYHLSAWVYAETLEFRTGITVRDLSNNNYLTSVYSSTARATELMRWKKVETSFTIPANTSSIQIWLMNRNLGAAAYFDDVRLTRIGDAPPAI